MNDYQICLTSFVSLKAPGHSHGDIRHQEKFRQPHSTNIRPDKNLLRERYNIFRNSS